MSNFESLSDSQLRSQLLDRGYDVPVSLNRDFLLKKLKSLVEGGGGSGKKKSTSSPASRRRTVGPTTTASSAASKLNNSTSSSSKPRRLGSLSTSFAANGLAEDDDDDEEPSFQAPPKSWTPSLSLSSTTRGHGHGHGGGSSGGTSQNQNTSSNYSYSNHSSSSSTSSPGQGQGPGGNSNGIGGGKRYESYLKFFRTDTVDDQSIMRGVSSPSTTPLPSSTLTRRTSPITSVSKTSMNNYNNAAAASNLHAAAAAENSSSYVSKIILCVFLAFFVVLGAAYYLKINGPPKLLTSDSSAPSPPAKPTVDPVKQITIPICGKENVDNFVCIEKNVVKDSRTLFNLLRDELTLRSKWKGCQDTENKLTIHDSKKILINLISTKMDIDVAFRGLLILIAENPAWSLTIEEENESSTFGRSTKEILQLNNMTSKITLSPEIPPHFFCVIFSALYTFFNYIILLILCVGSMTILYKTYVYFKNERNKHEVELYGIVDHVLEILQRQYDMSKTEGGDAFIAITHLKDQLFSPMERPKKNKLWNEVVNYISNNESRIREEIQHISGEEFRVWRWIPSRLSTSYSTPIASGDTSLITGPSTSVGFNGGEDNWQGQAFTVDGTANALPKIPTNCLKVRQMINVNLALTDEVKSKIEQVILKKCHEASILHIGFDNTSGEGLVYIRCATKDDARKTYIALHAWWYEGSLLSVKFLKEERYFSRFPESQRHNKRKTLGLYPNLSGFSN